MLHLGLLLALGVIGPLLAFAAWRGRGLAGWRGVVVGLAAMLWWAELLLTVHGLWRVQVPSEAPDLPAEGILPWVAGHTILADHAAPRSDQPTVLFVGDSITYGQGVRAAETFPRRVGEALTAAGDPTRVLVHAAQSRSLWDEAVLYTALGAPLAPDVVVWVVFLNDFGWPGAFEQTDLVTEFAEPTPTGVRVLDALRLAAWQPGATAQSLELYRAAVAPERPEWLHAQRTLASLAGEVVGRGGRFVLAIFPVLHELEAYPLADVHARVAEAGRAAGAEVVDLAEAFAGQHAPSLWVSRHDHHPNAAGHALAADALLAAVRARPVPASGPSDCAALPVLPGLETPLRAACDTDRDPAALMALAEALLLTDKAALPSLSFDGGKVAADLAVVASSRSVDDPDLALAARGAVFRGRAWGRRSSR